MFALRCRFPITSYYNISLKEKEKYYRVMIMSKKKDDKIQEFYTPFILIWEQQTPYMTILE